MLASAVTAEAASVEEGKGGEVVSERPESSGDEPAALQLPRKPKSTSDSNWGSIVSTPSYQTYSEEHQNSCTSELYVALMNHFAKIGGYEAMLYRVNPNPAGTRSTRNFPCYVATLPEMKAFLEILYTGVPCYSATFVMDFFPRWRQASYARLDKLSLDELRDCGNADREALDVIHSLRQLLSSLLTPLPSDESTPLLYNNDAYHEICLASLTRQLVDCPFLKARLRGMALLTELIEAVCRDNEMRKHFYRSHNSGGSGQQFTAPLNPAFHWLTCEKLSTWIYENCVIESAIFTGYGNPAAGGKRDGDDVVLLKGNTTVCPQLGRELHPEVLKRSEPVLLFVASMGKLSSAHIDLLWKAGEDSVQDTRRASHGIFILLASGVDVLLLQKMHNLLNSLPEALNKAHVELIKGFADAVLSRGLDIGGNELMSSSTESWRDPAAVVSGGGGGQERNSLLLIFASSVELLWKATQESSPVSREVCTAASNALTEVLSCRECSTSGSGGNVNGRGCSTTVSGWIGEGTGGSGGKYTTDADAAATHFTKYTPAPVLEQLKFILNCCCQNIKDGKSVLQSLQLMLSLLSAQAEASRLPVPEDSCDGLLIELEKHHRIMDEVLSSILAYSHEVRKKKKAAENLNWCDNAIMGACLMGNISHRELMMVQLDFLRFAAGSVDMCIPFSTIERLWKVIVMDPICPDESELFFEWLSNVLGGQSEYSSSSSTKQYSSREHECDSMYGDCNVLALPPSSAPDISGGDGMGWKKHVDDSTVYNVFEDLLCSNEFDTVNVGPLAYNCFELVFQFVNMKCGALRNSLHPTPALVVKDYSPLHGLGVLWDMFLQNTHDQVSYVAGAFFIRLHSLSQYSSVEESLKESEEFITRWCMTSLENEVDTMEGRTAACVTPFDPIHSVRTVKLLNRFFSDIENTSTVDSSRNEDHIKVIIREVTAEEIKEQGQVTRTTTTAAPSSIPSISTLSFTYPKNGGTPVQLRALVAQNLRTPPQLVRLQNLHHKQVVTPHHDDMNLCVNFPGDYCEAIILPSPAKDTFGWNPPKDASTVGWCTGTPHANVHRLISESEHHMSVLFRLLEGWPGINDEGLMETWKLLQHLPLNESIRSEIKAFGRRKQEKQQQTESTLLLSPLLPDAERKVVMHRRLFDSLNHAPQLYRFLIICHIIAPSVSPYSLSGDKAVADAWIAGFLSSGGMRQLLELILCSGKQRGLDTSNKLHRIWLALLLRVITTFTLLDRSIPSDCLVDSSSETRDDSNLSPKGGEAMAESGVADQMLQEDDSEGVRENSLSSRSCSSSWSSSDEGEECYDVFSDEFVDSAHIQSVVRSLYEGVDLDDLSERMLNIMTSVCRAGARGDGIGNLTSTLENLKIPPPPPPNGDGNLRGGIPRASGSSAAPQSYGLHDKRSYRSSFGSATEMNYCNGMPLRLPVQSSHMGRKESELLECVTPCQNELPPEAEVVQHTMTILSRVTLCTPHLLGTILRFPDFGVALNFILLHASESSVRKKVSYGLYKMAESLRQAPSTMTSRRSNNRSNTDMAMAAEGGEGGVVMCAPSPDPVAFFIHELLRALPSAEKYPSTCAQYFHLLSSLIDLSGGLPVKELIALCHQLSKCISQKRCCEATEDDIDLPLQGYMSLLRTVLRTLAAGEDGKNGTAAESKKIESCKATEDSVKKEIGIHLLPELLQNCIFSPPSNEQHVEVFITRAMKDSSVPLPKCKNPKSRRQAFLLLVELTRHRSIILKDKEGDGCCDDEITNIVPNLIPEDMFNDNFSPLLEVLSQHHKLIVDDVCSTNQKDGRSRSRGSSFGGGQIDGQKRSSGSAPYNRKALLPSTPHTKQQQQQQQQQFQQQQYSQYPGPLNSSRHTPRRHYNGYCGLKNMGCICYMNATLQQLFMVPGFRDGVLSASDGCSESSHESSSLNSNINKASNLLWQLQSLFSHLLALEKSYYDPIGFCNAIVDMDGEPIDVLEQQDADEFVLRLFQQIEARIMGTPSEHIIKDIFGGLMVNELIADGGRYSERSEAFNMIKVDVKDHQNLLEGLSSYVAGETVDYTWEHEHVETGEKMVAQLPTTKRVLLKSLPESLIIHLKRFEFDFETMQQIKINDRYEFPMELDLYPYTKEGVNSKEEGHNDPEGNHDDMLYTLMGIVVHIGTANSGHYYSIIKERGSNDRWFEFNDVLVTEFDPQDIPAECFGGHEEVGSMDKRGYFRNAFMLVYDKTKQQCHHLNEENENSTTSETNQQQQQPHGTSVTAVEREKKEEDINGVLQETPRHYQERKHHHAPIPPDILRDIQLENMEYWQNCNITDDSYYDFMMELCGRPHLGHQVTQHYYKGPWPTEMIKLATKFVCGTLLGAGDAWIAARWLHGALQHQYTMNIDACNWLLRELDRCPDILMNLLAWYIGHNGKLGEYGGDGPSSCVTISSLLVSIVVECMRRGRSTDQPELPPMKLIDALIRAIAKSPSSPEANHWISIVRTFASMSTTHASLITGSGLLYLLMESVPLNSSTSASFPNQLPHVQYHPSKLGHLLELIAFILSSQSVGGALLLPTSLEEDADGSSIMSSITTSSAAPLHRSSPFTAEEASLLGSCSFLSSVVGECRAPALQCHAKSLLHCLAFENKVLSERLTAVIVHFIKCLILNSSVKPAMRAALILIASVKDTLSEWRCDHIMKNILPAIRICTYQDQSLYDSIDMLFRIAGVSDQARSYLQGHYEEWHWILPIIQEIHTMPTRWGNRLDPRLCTMENLKCISEVIDLVDSVEFMLLLLRVSA